MDTQKDTDEAKEYLAKSGKVEFFTNEINRRKKMIVFPLDKL